MLRFTARLPHPPSPRQGQRSGGVKKKAILGSNWVSEQMGERGPAWGVLMKEAI